MSGKVKVVEKNEGAKIAYEQQGTKLFFGDDEIMLNVAKYQKEWPVVIDICKDKAGNLTIGTESANRYVAQVEIPEVKYTEIEKEEETERKAEPLDMSEVILILWSVD